MKDIKDVKLRRKEFEARRQANLEAIEGQGRLLGTLKKIGVAYEKENC